MAGDSVDIPFPGNFLGIANRAIENLTDKECLDMAAWYYDRYLWSTDDREDLHMAALYKHLAHARGAYTAPITKRSVRSLLEFFYRREPSRLVALELIHFPKRF